MRACSCWESSHYLKTCDSNRRFSMLGSVVDSVVGVMVRRSDLGQLQSSYSSFVRFVKFGVGKGELEHGQSAKLWPISPSVVDQVLSISNFNWSKRIFLAPRRNPRLKSGSPSKTTPRQLQSNHPDPQASLRRQSFITTPDQSSTIRDSSHRHHVLHQSWCPLLGRAT